VEKSEEEIGEGDHTSRDGKGFEEIRSKESPRSNHNSDENRGGTYQQFDG